MFQIMDNISGNIKYVGISRAVVIDNNDPLKRGRIRVNSPVLGETAWIPYLTSPGTFTVPEPDDVVYIQCDGGYYTHPIAWGNLNRGADDDLQFPEEFQRVSPTNRGFYTPDGHLIEFDDGSDIAGTNKGIRITTSDGSKVHIKSEPTDSSINIETPGGALVNVDGTNDKITAQVAFGDTIEISAADGIQASTPAAGGTSLSMKSGKIDITCAQAATFTSEQASITVEGKADVSIISDTGSLNLNASAGDIEAQASGGATLKLSNGKVGLGIAAAELVDLLDQTIDQLKQTLTDIQLITVPTAVGPSGVPVNASSFAATISALTSVKTKVTSIKGGV